MCLKNLTETCRKEHLRNSFDRYLAGCKLLTKGLRQTKTNKLEHQAHSRSMTNLQVMLTL